VQSPTHSTVVLAILAGRRTLSTETRRLELERARDRARQADEVVDDFGVEAVELAAELLGDGLIGFLVGFFPQSAFVWRGYRVWVIR